MKASVSIESDGNVLKGILSVPEREAIGAVIFAHGSGSGRLSPRNNFAADFLNREGIITFLPDLLTEDEDKIYENRFDIELLSERLTKAIDWLKGRPETKGLPIGLFGASTGAAAALQVASKLKAAIRAVVSRGGRPDLAGGSLGQVISPTLLIVGSEDAEVLSLNREALQALRCENGIEIIPGATHLFAEPGALEEVSRLAAVWFRRFFTHAPDQTAAVEANIPPRFHNEAEKPTQAPGKTRAGNKEGYRHFHQK